MMRWVTMEQHMQSPTPLGRLLDAHAHYEHSKDRGLIEIGVNDDTQTSDWMTFDDWLAAVRQTIGGLANAIETDLLDRLNAESPMPPGRPASPAVVEMPKRQSEIEEHRAKLTEAHATLDQIARQALGRDDTFGLTTFAVLSLLLTSAGSTYVQE